MVNNDNKSGNKTRTTAKYKLHTDTLTDGLTRLQADNAYFSVLANSKDARTRVQGRNGVKATLIQITRQKLALANDRAENEAAFRRGEIFKFWK